MSEWLIEKLQCHIDSLVKERDDLKKENELLRNKIKGDEIDYKLSCKELYDVIEVWKASHVTKNAQLDEAIKLLNRAERKVNQPLSLDIQLWVNRNK